MLDGQPFNSSEDYAVFPEASLKVEWLLVPFSEVPVYWLLEISILFVLFRCNEVDYRDQEYARLILGG